MTSQQIAALQFIARNPGCCTMDVCRAEWSGRGHAASYDRVNRLRRRGLVQRGHGSRGTRPLWLSPAGAALIGVEPPTHVGVTYTPYGHELACAEQRARAAAGGPIW